MLMQHAMVMSVTGAAAYRYTNGNQHRKLRTPSRGSSNATRTRPHTVTAETRHTAAYRMARDPQMPLTDVQWVLGHAQLTTTQIYVSPLPEDVIANVLAFHQRGAGQRPQPSPPSLRYRPESLNILFGTDR